MQRPPLAADLARGTRTLLLIVMLLIGLLVQPGTASAQSVCLPLPRLLTTMPMGGRAGTSLDVTVTGEHITGATALRFSHPGLSAVVKKAADGADVPGTFVVTIKADALPGAYEAAVVSPAGVSASRIFCVGSLPEVIRPGDDAPFEMPVGAIANGVARGQQIDTYRIAARGGRRLLIECAAPGIDSRMHPVVILADHEGRDLVVERRGGVLDFTPPSDGTYLVKVHDLCHRGGREFFYRLVVQEAEAGVEPPRHPIAPAVASFSWPPAGLAAAPARREAEPARSEAGAASVAAERIELPCDIGGRFFPAADVDTFEFAATAGESWWIEVASQRLGASTAPAAAIVQLASGEGGERIVDVLQLAEIPAPIKPSSNFYSYDGPPYNAGSPDLLGRLDVKETGTYRIALRDRFGGTRDEPRSDWRLVVRRADPDFALAGWALHMELRNGDRADLSKPLALRRGSTVAVEVAVVRRDGFDGAIDLAVDGLPTGVTGTGLRIPAGKNRGLVLVTAAADAAVPPTPLCIVGRASVDGREIERVCRMATVAWPVRDHSQEIPLPRLTADPCVSVSAIEDAPLTITTGAVDPQAGCAVMEAAVGTTVTVPLGLVRRAAFSGGLIRLKAFGEGFEAFPVLEVPLTADSAEAVLDLAKLKIPPGRHTLAFYGTAIVQYAAPTPPAADGKPTEVKPVDTAEIVISQPVTLIVSPPVQQAAAAVAEKERS
jgi:hypothetical protein